MIPWRPSARFTRGSTGVTADLTFLCRFAAVYGVLSTYAADCTYVCPNFGAIDLIRVMVPAYGNHAPMCDLANGIFELDGCVMDVKLGRQYLIDTAKNGLAL